MGTPEDFVRGSADLVRGIAPSPGAERSARRVAGARRGAGVAPGAVLIGGTVVGRGAEIGAGARLDGAVIFDGAKVEAGATWSARSSGSAPDRSAGAGPRRRDRRRRRIGARCELLRGARVWPGVTLPDGGLRFSTDV